VTKTKLKTGTLRNITINENKDRLVRTGVSKEIWLENHVDKISIINTKTNTKWKSDINLAVFSQGDSIFQYINQYHQGLSTFAVHGGNHHYSLWVRQTL
jgi:hypothetical protein